MLISRWVSEEANVCAEVLYQSALLFRSPQYLQSPFAVHIGGLSQCLPKKHSRPPFKNDSLSNQLKRCRSELLPSGQAQPQR